MQDLLKGAHQTMPLFVGQLFHSYLEMKVCKCQVDWATAAQIAIMLVLTSQNKQENVIFLNTFTQLLLA